MAEDWDLFALVRSCTSAAHNSAIVSPPPARNDLRTNEVENRSRLHEDPLACLASLKFEEEDDPFSFPNLSEVRKSGSLKDSYKPFLAYPDPTTTTIITTTHQGIDPSSGGSNGQHHHQEQPPPLTPLFAFAQSGNHQHAVHVGVQQQEVLMMPAPATVVPLRNMQSQAPRARKRKNQQKREVRQVTAENLSSDPWAWRKYGQKPIKGSPYPRNYYRCSSSKGCSARKQVERSPVDPNIFIITYTGDHTHPRPTHRNSLAGSTRNKLSTAQRAAGAANNDSVPAETLPTATASASCSSPPSGTSLSPISPTTPISAPEDAASASLQNQDGGDNNGGEEEESADMMALAESDEDDDDDLLIPNVHVDEDIFKGLEHFIGGGAGNTQLGRSPTFSDNFTSWGAAGSSAAAGAAAGGGC
ncbi:DNA-binding WRKY [Corchorus capsularis]|uniref:DNA-binding WRKY n=1 Tax=Corchorus capsularis TaxID=210143 RepID=A0A1R3FZN9_COCAP|nr:DNA-binding WRKY [Corchorus capsularis]